MIAPARWVLAEAWLSLGLRLRTMNRHTAGRYGRDQLMDDEETRLKYVYDGSGIWLILVPDQSGIGYPNPTAPEMGLLAMRHELAHYLVATEDRRREVNFGLTQADDEAERRALEAESVIDAMINGCARIVSTALAGRAA